MTLSTVTIGDMARRAPSIMELKVFCMLFSSAVCVASMGKRRMSVRVGGSQMPYV